MVSVAALDESASRAAVARLEKFKLACGRAAFAPVVKIPARARIEVLDLSKGPVRRRRRWPHWVQPVYEIGKYDERRENMYETELFKNESTRVGTYDGLRDIHIGLDVGAPRGTGVYAPLDGCLVSFGYNSAAGDYGHVLVTEHVVDDVPFWILYGHLSASSVAWKRLGQHIHQGDRLGSIGGRRENGGWPDEHVHIQIALRRPDTHDMPGVVSMAQHEVALLEFPDPRLVLGPLY